MTLVDVETGEVVAQCTPEQARYLTNSIKGLVSATWELVAEAYNTRAWAALGYGSWDDYTSAEFSGSQLRLPREERQEVVGSLRDAGLSIRAIAAATGSSDQTVQRDIKQRQVSQITTPDGDSPTAEVSPNFKPPKVKGRDGKTYTVAPTKEQQRAQAIEAYPWLDCPAPATEIIMTAQGLTGYVGAELEERIETSKKWAASEHRRAADLDAIEAKRVHEMRLAVIEEALTDLISWCVLAGRAANVLKDHPSLVDPDDAEWLDAIEAARRRLDDLTPIPNKLRRVK